VIAEAGHKLSEKLRILTKNGRKKVRVEIVNPKVLRNHEEQNDECVGLIAEHLPAQILGVQHNQ
jgi:hypothetical protein